MKKMNGRTIYVPIGLFIATCVLLSQYRSRFPSQYASVKEIDKIDATVKINEEIKYILYWTPMFDQVDFNLGLGSEMFENCTYKNCYATHRRDEIPVEKFDAVLFHGVEYTTARFGEPEKRSPNQVYVFSIQESPIYSPSFIKDYKNFYNWTMTYRLDSDILRPYGIIKNQKTAYRLPSIEDIQSRPKKIAWFVSNCGTSSERERLYNELRKHVQIDVFGACGDLDCPKQNARECYAMIEKDYKFYLSFENSICEDYVTEKLYYILNRNIVPIVYGGADYNSVAPPKSVINVMDYKSIKDLVTYIRYLDTYPEKYLEYLEWKKDYVIDLSSKHAICTLCKKLNEPIKPKTYSDLYAWWFGDNLDKCSNDFLKRFL